MDLKEKENIIIGILKEINNFYYQKSILIIKEPYKYNY